MSNENTPDGSPNKIKSEADLLLLPSPIITRRTRTASTCDRAMKNPVEYGIVSIFCRSKGHGFITPKSGGDDLFCHVSDVEGEYVPLPGDEVSYRLCAIPPKFDKYQAIHVEIIHLVPEKHLRWDDECKEQGHIVH